MEVVVFLIIEKEKILIEERVRKTTEDKYFLPGGTIESKESKEQTIIREGFEELSIKIIKFKHFKSEYCDKFSNVLLHYFLIKKYEGIIKPVENQILHWLKIDELEMLDHKHDREIAKKALEINLLTT